MNQTGNQSIQITRRDMLGLLAGAGAAAVFNTEAGAQTSEDPAPRNPAPYTPDFRTQIGEHAVGVDIDLLGPNGEVTVGFLASLDPHHGAEWRNMPEEARQSTSIFRIHDMLVHMNEHEITSRQIEAIYVAAHAEWVKKYQPENAQAAPEEGHAPEHNHDH